MQISFKSKNDYNLKVTDKCIFQKYANEDDYKRTDYTLDTLLNSKIGLSAT